MRKEQSLLGEVTDTPLLGFQLQPALTGEHDKAIAGELEQKVALANGEREIPASHRSPPFTSRSQPFAGKDRDKAHRERDAKEMERKPFVAGLLRAR